MHFELHIYKKMVKNSNYFYENGSNVLFIPISFFFLEEINISYKMKCTVDATAYC